MRATWLVVVAALAVGPACKKDSSSGKPGGGGGGGGGGADPAAVSEIDELWKLAPKWATGGAVITGAGLVQVDRGLAFVHGLAGRIPGGDDLVEELEEMRHEVLGTATTYADAGIDLAKGGAVFFAQDPGDDGEPNRVVAIAPVGDRDKFLATHGGTKGADADTLKKATCKTVGKVYACGKSDADLVLGGGDLGKSAGVDGVRGDFELVMTLPAFPREVPMTATGPLSVAVGIKRGEVIARGHLPAKLDGPLAALAKAKPANLNIDQAAGFLIAPADVVAQAVPMDDAPPPAVEFFKSIAGALTAVVPAGVADVDVRLPLTDAKPAKLMMNACGHVGPPDLPMVAGPDSCTIGPVPVVGLTGTVWIDGNSVRAARAKGAIAKGVDGVPPTAVGKALAGYTFAAWGRGSVIGVDLPGQMPPQARIALATMGYVSEMGIGAKFTADGISGLAVVRTIHTNPDDVIGEIEGAITGGADAAKAAAIGKAHAGTPFAADVAAGATGLLLPAAGFGGVAVLTIRKKQKDVTYVDPSMPPDMDQVPSAAGPPEASILLNRIGKDAKVYYITNAEFPEGDSGRTPAKAMCDEADKRHTPNAADWSNPVWSKLDFQIDEPFMCEYQYKGTKTGFTATATCDLDCDGSAVVSTATGTVDQGNPTVTFATSGTD